MLRYFTSSYWNRLFYRKKKQFFPSHYAIWDELAYNYNVRTGKILSYRHPKDINQKLYWLNRYWQEPLKTQCADKYAVRDYVKYNGLGDILVPLIGVWNNAEQIDFDNLPNQFVLKCNHGSGYNIMCLDKNKLNISQTISTLNSWMREDFSLLAHELHYSTIPRKVICEKVLSNTAPLEYQLWCINGEPDSFLICRKGYEGGYDSWSYSLNWERLYDRLHENEENLPEPCNLTQIIEDARILSKPFPFVRVDFYNVEERIYFAELTFTPAANFLSAYKDEFIERLGKKLILPRKTLSNSAPFR